jgi:hypothetical protein
LSVQALAGGVHAGGNASYAIWVWFAGNVSGTATVTATATPGKLTPSFTVCQVPGSATCSVGLAATQPVELQVKVPVPASDAGIRLTLTATGTSPQAGSAVQASGSVLVAGNATPTPSPSATTPAPAGVGVTVPPGTLPPGSLQAGNLPSGALPVLPDPAANPGLTFPTISPGPDPSPAPSASPIRVTDVSASFPLDKRLIGGQLIGLAVLAAAVTIAVARLSLRRPRPKHSKDPG